MVLNFWALSSILISAAMLGCHYLWAYWVQKKHAASGANIHRLDNSLNMFRIYFAVVAVVLVSLTFSGKITFTDMPVPLRWVGFVMGLLGIYVFNASHYHLAENWMINVARVDNQKLITSGLYKHLRHPMYTSFLLFTTSLVLMTGTYASLFLFIANVAMLAYRIPREDRLMANMFGNEHKKWAKNTFIIVPRVI